MEQWVRKWNSGLEVEQLVREWSSGLESGAVGKVGTGGGVGTSMARDLVGSYSRGSLGQA